MMNLNDSAFGSFRRTIDRLADRASADAQPPARTLKSELDELRSSLESVVDGYRHAAIGMAGVFEADNIQSIAALLAQSVVDTHGLTTTIARITRHDVEPIGRNAIGATDWRRPLRPAALNIWPSVRPTKNAVYRVDDLEFLHWLRTQSEFSIATFDSLGDVISRLALAKRLDGIIVVNSGRQFDVELMAAATEMLERKGVRILGQVRNLRNGMASDLDRGLSNRA